MNFYLEHNFFTLNFPTFILYILSFFIIKIKRFLRNYCFYFLLTFLFILSFKKNHFFYLQLILFLNLFDTFFKILNLIFFKFELLVYIYL